MLLPVERPSDASHCFQDKIQTLKDNLQNSFRDQPEWLPWAWPAFTGVCASAWAFWLSPGHSFLQTQCGLLCKSSIFPSWFWPLPLLAVPCHSTHMTPSLLCDPVLGNQQLGTEQQSLPL